MLELKITASDPAEFAQQINGLFAVMNIGRLRSSAAAPAEPAEPETPTETVTTASADGADIERVDPPKKPRGRPRYAPTPTIDLKADLEASVQETEAAPEVRAEALSELAAADAPFLDEVPAADTKVATRDDARKALIAFSNAYAQANPNNAAARAEAVATALEKAKPGAKKLAEIGDDECQALYDVATRMLKDLEAVS